MNKNKNQYRPASLGTNRGPFRPKRTLWWVAIIALGFAGAFAYFLRPENVDLDARGLRVLIPTICVIIAGFCVIIGTAERWFK